MNFNSEELKLIEAERKEILNEILEELQTKSLKELFLETSDKEKRIEEVRYILKEEYEILDKDKQRLKSHREKEDEVESHRGKEDEGKLIDDIIVRMRTIDGIKDDYSNYIQGGEGFISDCLRELDKHYY